MYNISIPNVDERIYLSSMTFEDIKEGFKNFLRTDYSDYDLDYEGSSEALVIDMFSYFGTYIGTYANYALGEAFLETSVKRSSAVLHSKPLGYLPASIRASKAQVNISFTTDTLNNTYTIPKGTSFTANTVDGDSVVFSTVEDITISKTDGVFSRDIEIYQGFYINKSYVYNSLNNSQRFVIPNDNDVSLLNVYVKVSSNSTTEKKYEKYDKHRLLEYDGTSEIYFVTEGYDEKFEVIFGDNRLGKSLSTGNVVRLEHFITVGPDANGITSFSLDSIEDIPANDIEVTVLRDSNDVTVPSYGGASRETIESIKFLAPRTNATNERAVIFEDYVTLIKRDFPWVRNVNVWSGQDETPKHFAKIFFTVEPENSYYLNTTIAKEIEDRIKERYCVASMIPEFVFPEYIEAQCIIEAFINKNKFDKFTGVSEQGIQTSIVNSILDLVENRTNGFFSELSYSEVVKAVQNSSDFITKANINVKISQNYEIKNETNNSFYLHYNCPLFPLSFISSRFYFENTLYYLKDFPTYKTDGSYSVGKIYAYRVDNNIRRGSISYGDIDYLTGQVTISNFNPTSIVEQNVGDDFMSFVASAGIKLNISSESFDSLIDFNIKTNGKRQLIKLFDNTPVSVVTKFESPFGRR